MVAAWLGLELMPWQRQVAEVATEYDPITGVPYYREVFVTTPRQAGKTTLILVMLIVRCLTWERPQMCVWTGQDGQSIRRKWLNEIVPEFERSDIAELIAENGIRRANGSESVEWKTGSRIELLPTSETAGHGMVLDFAVLDEIFADHDNRREAALLPAMATKPDAQMLTCSTAGTGASTVYNRKVRSGRNAVAEGKTEGLAYFEWSAPDGWDPNDDSSFARFHPAIGHTQNLAAIRQARDVFAEDPAEFARAYGNRPMLEGGGVIPEHIWASVVDSDIEASMTGLAVAVDVSPDRDRAAIAICDDEGTAELIEYREGIGWLVERVTELADRYSCPVAFDARGPAGSVHGLEQVDGAIAMSSTDVIRACGAFFDAVADRTVRVRQSDAVDRAVRGLEKKTVGDAYVWSRRASSKDVTPLYAITLAYAASREGANTVPPAAMYVSVS